MTCVVFFLEFYGGFWKFLRYFRRFLRLFLTSKSVAPKNTDTAEVASTVIGTAQFTAWHRMKKNLKEKNLMKTKV